MGREASGQVRPSRGDRVRSEPMLWVGGRRAKDDRVRHMPGAWLEQAALPKGSLVYSQECFGPTHQCAQQGGEQRRPAHHVLD